MRIYLIFDMADLPEMSIQEAHDAKQKFIDYARTTKEFFTYDLLASEQGHLYRVGVCLINPMAGLASLPTMPIPRNNLGYFGACIDLSKLELTPVDREIFFYRPKDVKPNVEDIPLPP